MRSNEFRLVIEDECLAAWMAINNAFTAGNDWNPETDYWAGILVQLGEIQKIPQDQRPQTKFYALSIEPACEGVKEITRSQLSDGKIWINVVAAKSGVPDLKDPMTTAYLDRLFPAHETDRNKPQPLHRHLTPFWYGITVWEDWRHGYEMKAGMTGNIGQHNAYEFVFPTGDGFEFQIHGLTDTVLKSTEPLELRIMEGPVSPGHGDGNNPPQRP